MAAGNMCDQQMGLRVSCGEGSPREIALVIVVISGQSENYPDD